MAKFACLGNGTVLLTLDKYGQVKDFYYHYAGLENHIGKEFVHRIGVYCDNQFTWFSDPSWKIEVRMESGTMASEVKAVNDSLGLEFNFSDVVYNEANIFIREITVRNYYDIKRNIKIFFNQEFNISQSHIGETAYFDPREDVVIHYKGRRVFLVNAQSSEGRFEEYSVGLIGIEGKDGTFKDAEDGTLSGNGIEHGQVDSVIGLSVEIGPKTDAEVYYWITIARSIQKAKELNELVISRSPSDIIKTTKDYWRAWVKNQNFTFWGLDESVIKLFNQSLVVIRSHMSKNGAIIASGDSDLFQFGRDTYAYVWPRDAAFSALALEQSGDFNASRRFFEFCAGTITSEGYFMHKYRPDMSLGSSWHPWIREGIKQFPIQEDETALVIYALRKHFELSKDLEFVESVYNSLIKKAAEFMISYRDGKTGLPKASYDLWEQEYGISTFTSCSVYGALIASWKFAGLLGKEKSAEKYKIAADDIKKGILKYLYDSNEKVFYKGINTDKDMVKVNKTIDMSSVYGVFKFGVLEPGDKKLDEVIAKTVERLEVKTKIGGIARYEGDAYHSRGGNIPGNPWVITTMWLAQYYIARAKKESDMEPVRKWITWAVNLSQNSGMLSEQFDPYSGDYISATPLTWSHAEFILTIIQYLEKLEELGICKTCYPFK